MPELPPWPVAPRPFPEEALGGWLGRVATLYKMSVVQLCDDYGLDLARGSSNCGWLVQAPVDGEDLARLAWLARLDEETLHQIQTPAAWAIKRHAFPYCGHCLFVNPVDVTAPRWKREWFDPAAVWCDVHGTRLALAPSVKLSRCKNFDQIVKAIGRLEEERRFNGLYYRH